MAPAIAGCHKRAPSLKSHNDSPQQASSEQELTTPGCRGLRPLQARRDGRQAPRCRLRRQGAALGGRKRPLICGRSMHIYTDLPLWRSGPNCSGGSEALRKLCKSSVLPARVALSPWDMLRLWSDAVEGLARPGTRSRSCLLASTEDCIGRAAWIVEIETDTSLND